MTPNTRAILALLAALLLPAGAAFAQQQFHARHIYNENADARAEIHDALSTAASEHKRVILDLSLIHISFRALATSTGTARLTFCGGTAPADRSTSGS